MTNQLPVVAIVGRPNVGKSSLLNRLVERRVALVQDRPGVTRDRIYAPCEWNGREFLLVDTGGLSDEDEFWREVSHQVEAALQEASVIVFTVDAQNGLTRDDYDIADRLRRLQKPVQLAANKAEGRRIDQGEAYRLGLGEPVFVSALHGTDTGDLLDRIVELLPAPVEDPEEDRADAPRPLRVAIVGRPNAGKSTLVNRVLGADRMLVSEQPGTTTDAVDVRVEWGGERFTLVDTAGLRRPARVAAGLEAIAGRHARLAVERADIALLLIDADEGLAEQDKRILGVCEQAGCGVVIGFNKWDQQRRGERESQTIEQDFRRALPGFHYAPVVFLSARTGFNLDRTFSLISQVGREHELRVSTAAVNREIEESMFQQPPPSSSGRQLKLYYATQVGRRPPHFVLFVNDPELCHFSYRRFLENRLREAFSLRWTPVRVTLRRREGNRPK